MTARRRLGSSHLRVALAVVFSASLLAIGDLGAEAAGGRPPLPPSGREIAPGYIPRPCTTAEIGTQGYYFSDKAKQWVSAPFCYGKWGNLDASGSQIVAPGASVTVRAIPNGGSNSATYAPQTGSIQWQYPGKLVSGCGVKDLTCTVVAAPAAGAEWQWFEFHVSMPRTFFIDSPGDLCGGEHLCAGAQTNAWSWVGIAPVGSNIATTGGGLGNLPPLPLILAATAVAVAAAAAWRYNWRRMPAPRALPGDTHVGPLPDHTYASTNSSATSANPTAPTSSNPGGGGAAGGVGSAGGGGSGETDWGQVFKDNAAWLATHPDPVAADPTGGGPTKAGQRAFQQKVAAYNTDYASRVNDLRKMSDTAGSAVGGSGGQADWTRVMNDNADWVSSHPDPLDADPSGGGPTRAGQLKFQEQVQAYQSQLQERISQIKQFGQGGGAPTSP